MLYHATKSTDKSNVSTNTSLAILCNVLAEVFKFLSILSFNWIEILQKYSCYSKKNAHNIIFKKINKIKTKVLKCLNNLIQEENSSRLKELWYKKKWYNRIYLRFFIWYIINFIFIQLINFRINLCTTFSRELW